MVKVGQTTKDPEERARELSAATGVPTPFIVGFSVFVSDCKSAERHAHKLLEQRGIRVTENREFFRASLQEIVRVLIELEKIYSVSVLSDHVAGTDYEDDPSSETETLIEYFRDEGHKYQYGVDGAFVDHYAAENKYLSAIRLGSNKAKYELGCLYADRDSDLYNPKKATQLLIEVYESETETYNCLSALADIFIVTGQIRNAELAYEKLFEDRQLLDVYLDYQTIMGEPLETSLDSPEILEYVKFAELDETSQQNELDKLKQWGVGLQNRQRRLTILNNVRIASSTLLNYFRHLRRGNVRVIEAQLLYSLIPLLKLLVPVIYENWPPYVSQEVMEGISKYQRALSSEISAWQRENAS